MKKLLLLTIILSELIAGKAYTCTIIMVSDSSVVLAGSNEDSVFPLTVLWFYPATENNYARVCLGYKMIFNSIQGGMNEKGLFLDGNSLGNQGWEKDENKKVLFGALLDRILATCANVEEVKEFFNTYNTPELDQARIPVMDKSGASIIVEWYNGKVIFLETEKKFQIATNFVESKYIGGEKPCWRYNKAVELLDNKENFSIETVRNVLEETHLDQETSRTVYSFICDLKKGEIQIFNFHDYSRSLTFNLDEEINKGQKEYFLANIFDRRSNDYNEFIENSPVQMIERMYRSNKHMALMFFNVLKTNYPKAFNRELSINTLSQVGKGLVEKGQFNDGLQFFERNVAEFPDSARSHFELGNVYIALDKPDKAIIEYKKALDINPGHPGAIKGLNNLKQ